jgi:hypothetical protein
MPTRSASDYLSYQKATILSATGFPKAQTRNVLRYEGGVTPLNAITQTSEMRYVTTGRLPPGRVFPRPPIQNRANPKALSRVAFLSPGGVMGGIISQSQGRSSGTGALIVLQHNLIQNAARIR